MSNNRAEENVVSTFISENSREIGLYAILILAGFQMFLWSKENRDLKRQKSNLVTDKELFRLTTIVSSAIAGIEFAYIAFSGSKKSSSSSSSRRRSSRRNDFRDYRI